MSIPHANIFKHIETIQSVAENQLRIAQRIELDDVQEFAGGQTAVFAVPKLRLIFKFEKDAATQFEGYHGAGVAVQAAAYAHGLPVPKVVLPLQNYPKGNYYAEELLDGVTFGTLLNKETLSDGRVSDIGRKVGKFIALFDEKLGHTGDDFAAARLNSVEPDFQSVAGELGRMPPALRDRLSFHLDKARDTFSIDQIRMRLIHDDLHSGNIMIASDDRVSVFDFGIVRIAPIEYAFRMLAFRKPPFLEAALEECVTKQNVPFNLSLMAYFSIAQIFNPEMHMSDEKLGVVKMSDAKRAELAMNVALNLDILHAQIGYPVKRSFGQNGIVPINKMNLE